MSLTREELLAQIKRVYAEEADWDEARDVLLDHGDEAVACVIEILGAELAPEPMLRLARLLVRIGDPRALLPLLIARRRAPALFPFFGALLETVTARGSAGDIEALLDLLRRVQPRWVGTAFLAELAPAEAVQVAEALVRLAERDPQPTLRAALPLLRFNLVTPVEFLVLRRRLKAALTNEALPIPTTDVPSPVDLPLPGEGTR